MRSPRRSTSTETAITTSMTITIDFGYGEVDGETLGSDDLGESLANYAPRVVQQIEGRVA